MKIIGYSLMAFYLICTLLVLPIVSINGYFIEGENTRSILLIISLLSSVALWSWISQTLLISASQIYGFRELKLGQLSINIKVTSSTGELPKRVTVFALLLSATLFVHWFAIIYGVISVLDVTAFSSGPLGFSSSLYFSFLAMTNSLNDGILPLSEIARFLVVIQMMLGMFYAVFFFSMLVSFLREGQSSSGEPCNEPVRKSG